VLEDAILGTVRLSIPLLFAAFGGMLCERSGVANIALEALLLFSAFAAAAVTHATESLTVGIAAGLITAAIVGWFFAVSCIWGRADQIVVGTAFNFLAAGLIPVISRALFQVTGSTPALDFGLRLHEPLYFAALGALLVPAYLFLFAKTRHGLRLVAAGENPSALSTGPFHPRCVL
jgi:simple sugar transport system permease protein